jgi:RNA polymerase sigma-70 factor (ECF subfamily)
MNDLESLYRQHASAVLRFAWGLCGDRAAAEDIVSETFVRLLTKAPRIETETALAYVLAVARNTYLNGRRKVRPEVPLSDEIPDSEPDPTSRLHDRAQLEAVIEALRGMPEGERAALLLRVDHDMAYEEIAVVLGTSLSAAKVRVHRARLRLARAREGDERKP